MANVPYHDINAFNNGTNVILTSPNSEFSYQFAQTKDTIGLDAELYNDFLKNAISRFRHSPTYKNYKSHLYDIGLDRCQVLGNITEAMATLEMHHNFINIHDVSLMITAFLLAVAIISSTNLSILSRREFKVFSKSLYNSSSIFFCSEIIYSYWVSSKSSFASS